MSWIPLLRLLSGVGMCSIRQIGGECTPARTGSKRPSPGWLSLTFFPLLGPRCLTKQEGLVMAFKAQHHHQIVTLWESRRRGPRPVRNQERKLLPRAPGKVDIVPLSPAQPRSRLYLAHSAPLITPTSRPPDAAQNINAGIHSCSSHTFHLTRSRRPASQVSVPQPPSSPLFQPSSRCHTSTHKLQDRLLTSSQPVPPASFPSKPSPQNKSSPRTHALRHNMRPSSIEPTTPRSTSPSSKNARHTMTTKRYFYKSKGSRTFP